MRFKGLLLILLSILLVFGIAYAKGKDSGTTCVNSVYVKHFNMAGGDCDKCLQCHCKLDKKDKCGPAYAPMPLKGRPAHMGGPNHACTDCHDGEKAILLPAYTCFSDPGTTCAVCHGE